MILAPAPCEEKMLLVSLDSLVVLAFHSQAPILHGLQEGANISPEKPRPPKSGIRGPSAVLQLVVVHLFGRLLNHLRHAARAFGFQNPANELFIFASGPTHVHESQSRLGGEQLLSPSHGLADFG